MRRSLIALSLLALAACGGLKSTAEQAISMADAAIAAVAPAAEKVLPDDLAALTGAVASAKDAFARGEFQPVIDGLKDIPAQAAALGERVTGETARLTEEWNTLAVAMPRNLEAVKAELDKAAKMRRLSAEQAATARSAYEEAMAQWPAATEAWTAGNLAGAMSQANAMKATVTEAMLAVGLAADEKAWGNQMSAPAKP
jgi:hypothetical protein